LEREVEVEDETEYETAGEVIGEGRDKAGMRDKEKGDKERVYDKMRVDEKINEDIKEDNDIGRIILREESGKRGIYSGIQNIEEEDKPAGNGKNKEVWQDTKVIPLSATADEIDRYRVEKGRAGSTKKETVREWQAEKKVGPQPVEAKSSERTSVSETVIRKAGGSAPLKEEGKRMSEQISSNTNKNGTANKRNGLQSGSANRSGTFKRWKFISNIRNKKE
ncbi:MAG: hypothetical protein QW728_01795, partial [Thermoplasmata archaeon]